MKLKLMFAIFMLAVSAALMLMAGCGSSRATTTPPTTTGTPQVTATPQLPTLYKIVRVTLSPSYSCRSAEDIAKGYANTALFLSDYSKSLNGPELLFDGACGSSDYFGGQTAGDDLDVITDYGDVSLTDWAAGNAFSPLRRTDSIATFAARANVQVGHTYGVLINKDNVRGLLYFRVTAYVPNQKVDLEYAVMDYQVLRRL